MGCQSLNSLGVSFAPAKSNPAFAATSGVFFGPQYLVFNTSGSGQEVYHVYELDQQSNGLGSWVDYGVIAAANGNGYSPSPSLASGFNFVSCANFNWICISGFPSMINGNPTKWYVAFDQGTYSFWIWNDQLTMGNSPPYSGSAAIWNALYSMMGQVLGPSGVPGMTPFCGVYVTPSSSSGSGSGSSSSSSSGILPFVDTLSIVQTADGRLFSAVNGGSPTQQSAIGYHVFFVPSPTTPADLEGRV
jgi:hypothetical protein